MTDSLSFDAVSQLKQLSLEGHADLYQCKHVVVRVFHLKQLSLEGHIEMHQCKHVVV